MVRALASDQCGPGLIPGPGIICASSLLLVLVLVPEMRVFLRVLKFLSEVESTSCISVICIMVIAVVSIRVCVVPCHRTTQPF